MISPYTKLKVADNIFTITMNTTTFGNKITVCSFKSEYAIEGWRIPSLKRNKF